MDDYEYLGFIAFTFLSHLEHLLKIKSTLEAVNG